MGMGPVQFGAWAGTGILNSAQVAAAAWPSSRTASRP
jgi:uncharacterized membrane protein YadS